MRAFTSIACLSLAACITDVDLSANKTSLAAPAPTTISVAGELCTPVVTSPVKILIALDGTQSLWVTDPNGTRALAVRALLDSLPQDASVSVAVMIYRGNNTSWLSPSGLVEFTPIVAFDTAERDRLTQRILDFTLPSDSTDFAKALSDIYALLSRDISEQQFQGGGIENRARYSVIFLSDGAPTVNQDDRLLCGDDVRRVRALRDLTDDVTFSTVHLYAPPLSPCNEDAGVDSACALPQLPQGTCPKVVVDQNALRLQRMAELGGGTFQDFRDNTPVSFELTLAPPQRRLVLDKLVLSNLSSPAGSPAGVGDSDLDGLMDGDEENEGTDPLVADTDGDGYSDGTEVSLRARGALFSPVQEDPGCPAQMRGVDTDCDGLLDCDEQLIGTSSQLFDSDFDGVPDTVELKLGSQPAFRDLSSDPDLDALTTGVELTSHLDPLHADVSPTSTDYRYTLTRRAALEADGRQCWDFVVNNVTLADTVDGRSDILASYSMVWGDQPTGRTFLRSVRRATSTDITLTSGDFGHCN